MQKHWVEDLFPPTYAYSIDELLKASAITDTDHAETGTRQRHSDSKSYVTSKTRELYERVRVDFNQDIEERRQKSTQVGSPLSPSLRADLDLQSDTNVGQKLSGKTQKKQLDTDCMWSESELQILRDDHQKAKTELANVLVELRVVEEEKSKLETRFQEQEEKLKTLMQSLHSSQQKCKRLNVRCGHSESELRLANGKAKMLEEDVADLLQEKRTLKKHLREMQKGLQQEHRLRTELELQLQEDGHKLKMEHIATEEELKLDYQMQINRLYEELRETQEALEKEQKEHSINKKALNHLRTHFASQPLSDIPSQSAGPIKSW